MPLGLSTSKLDTTGYLFDHDDLPPLPDTVADDPTSAHLDPRRWFDHPERPFELEIGSGKGTFLAQQAVHQPHTNFLGIEYAGEFCRYAADRARRNQLTNVRLLHADAQSFVAHRLPPESCDVIHLYFPDPWPKKRHHKRRTLNDAFLRRVWHALKPTGELRAVTDHADYWAWMEERFARWAPTENADDASKPFTRHPFVRPVSASEGEVVGTNFERKYRVEGRTFNAATLRKNSGVAPQA